MGGKCVVVAWYTLQLLQFSMVLIDSLANTFGLGAGIGKEPLKEFAQAFEHEHNKERKVSRPRKKRLLEKQAFITKKQENVDLNLDFKK
jgi:hypothetical protein